MSFRPRGKRALGTELLQKGVDKKIIDSQLNQLSQNSQIKAAQAIITKKKKNYQNLSFQKAKKKLFALLARRGFEFSLIKQVIDESLKKK